MIKLRMQHLALIIALVPAALLVHAYPDDPFNEPDPCLAFRNAIVRRGLDEMAFLKQEIGAALLGDRQPKAAPWKVFTRKLDTAKPPPCPVHLTKSG
jgi:hypothetical protein